MRSVSRMTAGNAFLGNEILESYKKKKENKKYVPLKIASNCIKRLNFKRADYPFKSVPDSWNCIYRMT
jgi:hypothetical protein